MANSLAVTRVSSAEIRSHPASTAKARKVMSLAWPMGVATTYRPGASLSFKSPICCGLPATLDLVLSGIKDPVHAIACLFAHPPLGAEPEFQHSRPRRLYGTGE